MSAAEGWGDYPAAAEAHWIGRAEAATDLLGDAAFERLAHAVARLSDLFTTERPEGRFPDYFAEEELLAAYGIFFLPQSFVRTGYALAQAMELRGWRPASAVPAILDLGAGPGSCGVSVAHHLRRRGAGRVELAAVDRSPGALAGLERFAEDFLGSPVAVRTRVGDASRPETWPEGDFDVIVAGFVLNEMPHLDAKSTLAWFATLRRRLRPGGLILLLEPALRTTAERLQRLSEQVCAEGGLTRVGPPPAVNWPPWRPKPRRPTPPGVPPWPSANSLPGRWSRPRCARRWTGPWPRGCWNPDRSVALVPR
jgi:SAM-dependent methyltransferase